VLPLTTVVAGVIQQSPIVGQAVLDETPRCTILRVRGMVTVNPATSPAAATGYEVFMGIYVSSNSVVWDPETQIELPWMWHTVIAPQMGGTGVSDSNIMRFAAYFRVEIDVRAKRKTSEDDSLIFSIKNSANSGASVQYFAVTRTLLLTGH